MQGIATRLNYSSEDVDEEMEMEASLGFQLQPLRETKGQTMQVRGTKLRKEDHGKASRKRIDTNETDIHEASQNGVHDKDTSKYCEFHQIEEVVKSGRLAHLIKGIRKGRAKQTDTQLEEWTTPTVNAERVVDEKEDPILMIRVTNNPLKRKEPSRIISVEEMIFPPNTKQGPICRPYPHKRIGLRKASRKGPARWRSCM
ncbi:hypothetical protein Tco_0853272 [Tanacetum coccineum]